MLNRNNLEIAAIAPKEDSRFTMNGVHVLPDKTFVTDGHFVLIVETPKETADGFPWPEAEAEAIGTLRDDFQPFTIPAKDALTIAKSVPVKEAIPVLNRAAIGAETTEEITEMVPTAGTERLAKPNLYERKRIKRVVKLATNDLDTRTVHPVEVMNGTMPDVSRVLPNKAEYDLAVKLDLSILVPMLDQMRKLAKNKAGNAYATFYLKQPKQKKEVFNRVAWDGPAVVVEAVTNKDEQAITGLVMPCSSEDAIQYAVRAQGRAKVAA